VYFLVQKSNDARAGGQQNGTAKSISRVKLNFSNGGTQQPYIQARTIADVAAAATAAAGELI